MKLRSLVCWTILSLLTGCGFAFRKAPVFSFQSLYIQGPAHSAIRSQIRYELAGSSIQLVTDPQAADVILEIMADQHERQVLSSNQQGQIREFRLLGKVQYRLSDAAKHELIPPTEILLTRTITYSEAVVLAKELEEAQLYQDMEEEIARQIVQRLAAVKTLVPTPDEPSSDPEKGRDADQT
jgi:LPS-assembly lipoprotein